MDTCLTLCCVNLTSKGRNLHINFSSGQSFMLLVPPHSLIHSSRMDGRIPTYLSVCMGSVYPLMQGWFQTLNLFCNLSCGFMIVLPEKMQKTMKLLLFFSSHQVLLSIIDVWKYSMPLKISLPEAILKWTATATLMYLIHPKRTSLQVKQGQHHWNISAHDPLQTHHMRRKSVHKNGMVHRHAV